MYQSTWLASLARGVFEWVTDGRCKNLVKWEGKSRWIEEQIGFIYIVLVQAMFFICITSIAFAVSALPTRLICLIGLVASVGIIWITRLINQLRLCSLVESLDLQMQLQAIFSIVYTIFLHILWGGVNQGQNSGVFIMSLFGPFAMLQIAGSYYPKTEVLGKLHARGYDGSTLNPFRRSSSSLGQIREGNGVSVREPAMMMVRNGGILALNKSSSFNNTERLLSARMRPVYWTLLARTICVLVLACLDDHLHPIVSRPPWAVALASALAQLYVLVIFVEGTRVLPLMLATLSHNMLPNTSFRVMRRVIRVFLPLCSAAVW